MKKAVTALPIFLLILTACEKNSFVADQNLLTTSNGLKYRYSDFELYDSSTHIFYFRTSHPEFPSENAEAFSLLAYGDIIYNGTFHPAFSSSLPSGPYIDTYMSLYQDFAFRINFMSVGGLQKDNRNDPVLVSILKEHNLLHSGLSLAINSIERVGSELVLKCNLTNHDMEDLLVIDPAKTGIDLFHYFTNGLSLRDIANNTVYAEPIQPVTPDPWNGWDLNWLSQLKSGESREFTFYCPLSSVSSVAPGEYNAVFTYPGLEFQVSKEQLYQPGGRVWLGSVEAKKQILLR